MMKSQLDEDITHERAELARHPPGHPERSHMLLGRLARSLYDRFTQLGVLTDLEEAITLFRDASEMLPEEHPEKYMPLNNLAVCLFTRFKQLGEISDLDESISLKRHVLELWPHDHPERSKSLNNLANSLCVRFEQLGMISDLNEAIDLNRNALEVRPPGHPDRAWTLNNLANSLWARFQKLGGAADLDEAITLYRGALELWPLGHPLRPLLLGNLATSLSTRFKRLGVMSDLDEAITLDRNALDLRPDDHPERALSLNNLANSLSARFEKLGVMSDLDEAITLHRDALKRRPQGHPDRSRSLRLLAQCLLQKPTNSELHQEAFDLYSSLSDVSQPVSLVDLDAAYAWVEAAENSGHPTLLPAYRTALRLLSTHLTTLPSLPQHLELLKERTSSFAMDAFSACIRHDALTNAVELLEQGRGVFWSQLARLRSPVDEVIASSNAGKQLGQRFIQLTRELRDVLASHQTSQDSAWHLNVQLETVVSDIRKLPGFSRFLLPPLFSDLRQAASGGPVIIINASEYSCDGLVVLLDSDPIHVPLQITKSDVQALSSELRVVIGGIKTTDSKVVTLHLVKILRKLWDLVVSPVVKVLQEIQHPPQSRIWWCPTDEFSLLPLHAAGEYRKGQKNFSDLYISSYTTTLAALVHSRRPDPLRHVPQPELLPSDSTSELPRFIAVGQAQARGEADLKSVDTELISLKQRIAPFATLTCIEGQDAKVDRVAEELQRCQFAHLACHGIPNMKKPFESAFALADGPLTIEDIMRQDMRSPLFAYLSACHTTVGDEESPDEVLHLAGVIQFAGFRSIIGTMWAVDDDHATAIASKFYEAMLESGQLNYTCAAPALHKTLRAVKLPFDQRILFVHIGA